MIDHLIRGATIVDGTGAPARRGDVGISDGRIVAVGEVDEPAAETVEADGLVVAPGFVDPHTHYDAQLFWDPNASPSNVHGVTSVIGGNCGFSLAPLAEGDADYLRRMMARVEGMPLAALEEGLDWSWETFGDYLDRLESRATALNAGFLVGHCALRRKVMGPDSVGQEASEEQIAAQVALLHEALDAGGLGFSTGRGTHVDGDGEPVASRWASDEEILALCEAVRPHEGTTLEVILKGCLDTFSDDEVDFLIAMSRAADRPVNWNVLSVDAASPERVRTQLAASDRAAAEGARVVALTMPTIVGMNMSFGTYCAFNLIPGWGEILALPLPERMERLADAEVRAAMQAGAASPEAGVLSRLVDWGGYRVGDTYSEANAGLERRYIRDIAAERGTSEFDALLDVALADDLRTVLWPSPTDDDDASWTMRAETWDHPHTMLGGSDAGAHLDRMCGAPYPTAFLRDTLRGRKLVSLERAVQMLTSEPASLFGLRDRGVLREGAMADVVLFDPDSVGAGPIRTVADLPGGAKRLVSEALGVHRVWVNGVVTAADGEPTGATPGRVLRSGRDTATVTAR